MKSKLRYFIFFSAILSVLFVSIHVAANNNDLTRKGPDYNDKTDGSLSLSHDSNINLIHGTYEFDKERIFIEIIRGKEISRILRKYDSSLSLYEIDIRLSDQDGFPFFVQVGGHSPVDDEWRFSFKYAEGQKFEEVEKRSKRGLFLTKKMIKAFEKVKMRDDLYFEHKAIKEIKNVIESSLTVIDAKSESGLTSASVYTSSHRIEIWSKRAFLPGNILGDHSGTVAKVLNSNGSTYQVWSACNHGTCPGSSDMSLKCAKNFPNRSGFSQLAPMCTSPLQWDQSDWWNDDGRHVCNDDTYIQYYRIKYNSNPDTTGGTCSDTTLRQYAPSCW